MKIAVDSDWFRWNDDGSVEVSYGFMFPATCPESLRNLSAGFINHGMFFPAGSVARYFFDREHEQLKKGKNPQHVYFIQSIHGGPIKIGIARDIDVRLRELQVGNPHPLRVIGILKNAGKKREGELHQHFLSTRLCGEWFEDTAELRGVIHDAAY